MWLNAPKNKVADTHYDALDNLMVFLEKDGHQIDFNVVYFDSFAELEIEVYVDEVLVGSAHHWDDILSIYDSYFDERVDG